MEVQLGQLLLETFDDPQGHQHDRQLLLANDEVPDLLRELQGKAVQKQADEPLEQPQVISYVALLQH